MAATELPEKPPSDVGSTPSTIVNFDGAEDPYNPVNWPFCKKFIISVLYSLTSFGSVWASAAYAPANAQIADEFNVSPQVAIIGTSLLLLGWGFGPLLWAPLSELYGRKWPVLIPFSICTAMSFGTAGAKNIQTVMITRFFTGFFGCAPITCTGGVYVDVWNASQRGKAIVGYTLVVCGGPALAPVVGGAMIHRGVNWRWTEYATGILQACILILDLVFIKESYTPTLLTRKARSLRKSTGNPSLHAEWEEKGVSIKELTIKFGLRPLQLLMTPICFAITIYTSFIYGVYYASLVSFPIIFQETRGWNPLIGSLPFLALLVGLIPGGVVGLHNQSYSNNACRRSGSGSNGGGGKPVPEARLPPMMVASVFFAAGLFIMGWTSRPDIPWIATIIGVFMMGFGFYTLFTSSLNYLIDTFPRWSASALATNTIARSAFSAAFPLIVPPMYHRLGNGWAFSVFGFFAVLNVPIPFVFWVYGERIRGMGKYTARNSG
ncbi:hypothetical protein AJ79_01674 [Helicocarpus griseus UAMH5409]|uniref:Major facilitator superfamily (MFS) profile domain-containing protein n=1 Tax=Helicocarpus griseus UAMH5409 TaxID=1447875 RepID=A0A2B7Y6R4_9EURO|nr:hypothetical protein AJ79_01674 [Helicocarpus griseus UAMH5409]